jgi:glutathione peroxidase
MPTTNPTTPTSTTIRRTTRTLAALAAAAGALALAACSGDDAAPYRTPEGGVTDATPTSQTTPTSADPTRAAAARTSPSVRGVAFELADGTATSMDAYQGKVVLVVNTASRCGLAPQVAELEKLQRANGAKGFTVLAFPSASFNQEPLSSSEAAGYCADMGATYPVAAKVDVKGGGAHPLYATLSQQGGEPTWNYTKYLVDRNGNVVARFDPRTSPTDPAIQAAIDRALKG